MITISCVLALLALVAVGWVLLARSETQIDPADLLTLLMLLSLLDE